MRFVRSPLLEGTLHGYSTRQGGVSTGRYDSLNLGLKWGDDPARVAENRRRLAVDAGFDPARLATVRQVHGTGCLPADGQDLPGLADLAAREADAVYATEPGRVVGVYTADCVPILLSDGRGRVAAVHAGWRGTVADIAAVAVEALVSVGARREELRAALGPSIGPCCFEVGEEVVAEFAPLLPASVLRRPGQRPHVDLWAANAALLVRAGLRPEHIDAHPPCTMCLPERFYSFRRDGARIGQMLSFIVA